MKLSNKYQPLFDLPFAKEKAKKYPKSKYWHDLSLVSLALLTGGRGSVKSFASGLSEVQLSADHGYNVYSTRFTNVSLKNSVIPELVEKINMLGYNQFAKVNQNEIIFNEGTPDEAKIAIKGLKTSEKKATASEKSLKNFHCMVVEEAEELDDFNSFDKAHMSIRGDGSGKQVFTMLIMNPSTKEHFVYKKFYEEKGVPAGFNGVHIDDDGNGILYIHTTYLDCPEEFVPPHLFRRYEAARKIYNKVEKLKKADEMFKATEKEVQTHIWFDHIILGGWLDKAEGVIYTNWRYGDMDNSLPYLYGMDFGFSNDPDALVKVAIDAPKRIVYLKLLIYRNGLGTKELAALIKSSEVENKAIVADSSEQRLIYDLANEGINVFAVQKYSGSILSGIKLLKGFEIVVDFESVEIGKELNNYVWADKRIEIPVDMWNHALDAVRYAVQTALICSDGGRVT